MLITAIEITDYKRVRTVAITPTADAHIILIGGKNAQGKSSTLDALTAAFGGAKQLASDPVRHGADEAAIFVELDGGKLTIDRTILPDGKTKLEVRDVDGAVRKPQDVLDKLVGARFLDPLAFQQLAPKEQRAQLMKLIEGADRIDSLNEKRVRAFDRRTEIGRDLTKAEGELGRLAEVKVETPIDIAALNEEMRALTELQRRGDSIVLEHQAAAHARAKAKSDFEAIEIEIMELERRLADRRAIRGGLQATATAAADAEAAVNVRMVAAAEAWKAKLPRRDQLDADLKRAGEHNRKVYEAEAQNKRRIEAAAAVDKLKGERDELTSVLAKIEARKAEILGAAKLPVEGLAITDTGIELAGVPFEQASGSEKLRVALALAIAGSPGLNDVWIRDGALLDDDSLELVAKQAAAAGKRVWIERVGTKDPGVIVIQDGQVADGKA